MKLKNLRKNKKLKILRKKHMKIVACQNSIKFTQKVGNVCKF
jgi:hypothetical protein